MARELLPCFAMILVQVGFAGMNISSKLAMDSGMNPYVMVTYRQIFSTLVMAPFSYFWERNTRPIITLPILFQIFLCSVFGATLNQCLFFLGLKITTPTIACALNNLLPAITFIMAVPFGMEKIGIRRRAGKAKVVGTILCVGGAMLMSFYKGHLINLWESSIHWGYVENMAEKNSSNGGNLFLGPLFIIGSCLAWSGWFIIQAKMSEKFSAPYSCTALMCFMASIQCGAIGAFLEPNLSEWSLHSTVRLIAAVYSGVVGSALSFGLMSWCIERRGPLYVSMFNPLLLVIVAILGWALLDEKVYVGSVVGSVLIVIGLYAVLWGKEREMNQINCVDQKSMKEEENEERDQLPVFSKYNLQNAILMDNDKK